MNVTRSTLMRRGHLLTALAVAVLLVVSAGTAWAQTTVTAGSRFTTSSGTLQEGAATDDLSKPRPLKVTIRRTTRSRNDPYNASSGSHLNLNFEYNGAPVSNTNGGGSFSVTPTSGSTTDGTPLVITGTASLSFEDSDEDRTEGTTDSPVEVNVLEDEIVLTIEDVADDDDWIPEELVLTLSKGSGLGAGTEANPTVRPFTSKFRVTVEDDDPMPKLKFAPPAIQLAAGNMQTMTVGVGVGPGGRGSLPDATGTEDIRGTLNELATAGEDDILLSVSPPEAVGRIITISSGDDMLEADSQGRYVVGTIGRGNGSNGAVGTDDMDANNGIPLTIKAVDVSGFRDEQITFTLMDGRTEAQKLGDGGAVEDSDAATVTILSGEETPTVTFSTESVTMNEGDTETVHLLADGEQGDQVGTVLVELSGDATVVLEQGGDPIVGGVVQFGDSANAELTIRSLEDVRLEDGEEKMATVTITDASGANIGDPRTLTVTVVGSTAVPVLPLVGQLLLGLLLTAGGTRLYRRRQRQLHRPN